MSFGGSCPRQGDFLLSSWSCRVLPVRQRRTYGASAAPVLLAIYNVQLSAPPISGTTWATTTSGASCAGTSIA